ncbi:hypothetical protein [Actinoplanes sp. NPDC026670]|uniref:NACHT domain-containing protein n=1 Tax=Actinoplanes sp. NPDC026670 TaxID=3154700 RepID=UPI003401AAC8
MDQKNELLARLNDMVSSGRDRLGRATGRQRHELLGATHAVLVIASFFAALRTELGPVVDELALDETDKVRLVTGDDSGGGYRSAVEYLFGAEIPVPWAGQGFTENTERDITAFYTDLADRTIGFCVGLAAWPTQLEHAPGLTRRLVSAALDRYRAEYAALIVDVPEFEIWAMLGEHHATHTSLARLEELVARLSSVSGEQNDEIRRILADLNRQVLDLPMAELGDTDGLTAVTFPRIRDGYVEPRFRWAVMGRTSQPSREDWWSMQAAGSDLATFLAAYFASIEATELPLVILGHPGAGKSLLTKVCTARLSAAGSDAFVPIRIPLRDVPDPAASIYHQIDSVLQAGTHGRVPWQQLCAAGADRTRVVFLDGLDELMQASGATESRYLRNVMEFQRVEASTSGPVAVVVTSRTVVADLAAIPPGCLVIRLEEFADEQVESWARVWNRANTAGIEDGTLRRIDPASLLAYGELARQPLLLLLMATVATEKPLPAVHQPARLYRELLDDFVRRELDKPDVAVPSLTQSARHEAELWKLGLVAFGMVNRGQQHLHERDLHHDLLALHGPTRPGPARANGRDLSPVLEPARRLLGRFFFVHTAEADGGAAGRSYEFLHATFADYLIAHHLVEQLRQLYAAYARPASQQWDDDLLFALLSHRVLATTGSRSIDFFAEEAAAEPGIAWVLEQLVKGAQERWNRGRFDRYDPSGGTYLHRMAAYTANLVLLRIACSDGPVDLDYLCPDGAQTTVWWPALVGLWRAVLPASDLAAVTARAGLTDESPARLHHASHRGTTDLQLDLLAGDRPTALNRAAGSAFLGDTLILAGVPIASIPELAQWLGSHATASRITAGALRTAWNELRDQIPAPLVGPILATAARAAPALAYDEVLDLVRWARDFAANDRRVRLPSTALMFLIARHSRLVQDIPELIPQFSGSNLEDPDYRILGLASLTDDENGARLRACFPDGFFDLVGVSSAGRAAAALSASAAQWALPGLAAMLADDRP